MKPTLEFNGHCPSTWVERSMKMDYTTILPPVEFIKQITDILGTKKWTIRRYSDEYTGKIGGYRYNLHDMESDMVIAHWTLAQMIHCCGICVSTSSWVTPKMTGKGLGTVLNLLRIHQAREDGYGCLMCTDIESNTPQRRILQKNGWKDIHSFVNPRTKNTVHISVIDLR